MSDRNFRVRLASPTSFPLDPRHEQTRTRNVRQAVRVFKHHTRDSSRLLNLPDEILWLITEFVAEEERGKHLSSFALVHRECRQLARPHQFADVWITRSDKSWNLLRHILKEVNGESDELSIGTCIRSITFTIDEDLCVDYTCASDKDYEEWVEYWQGLIDDLALVFESHLIVPNLQRVYWMDTAELEVQPRLLKAVLQRSSISSTQACKRMTELYFGDYKFMFYERGAVIESFPQDHSLCIKSLAFGFDEQHSPASEFVDGCTAYFAETLLRRCASTLECFAWNARFVGELDPDLPDDDFTGTKLIFRDGPIKFGKLQKFWSSLTSYESVQPSVLENFLAAPLLESFSPSAHLSSMMLENGFVEKYPLLNLRTFAVASVLDKPRYSVSDNVDKVLTLACRYGPQIEELFIYAQGSVDQTCLHLSSGNFCKIRFLCFSWIHDPDFHILQVIGTHLTTLEELSFGFQPADEESGEADRTWDSRETPAHDAIIAAISPLTKLVRLGLFGDEYIADWGGDHWAWHRFFNEHVWFNQGRSYTYREHGHKPGDGMSWDDATRGHTRPGDKQKDKTSPWITQKADDPGSVMVEIAAQYAEAFPNLQEFMCGRHLVKVTDRV